MITEALQHCSGVGPVRLAQLHAAGLRSWSDILSGEDSQSYRWRAQLVEEVRQCAEALARDDVRFFVDRLAPQDKWRILAHFFERTTFFDIETTGLDYDATITVIICWHKGRLHTFIEHENLDDFLDLLDDVTLLASFNGSSFDVPRVLDGFHLPELPCPHLDMRWICYHQGFTGGLKEIAAAMQVNRPRDLQFVNGDDAVRLWSQWLRTKSAFARQALIRYCAADVLMLAAVAARLAQCPEVLDEDALWRQLPEIDALRLERRAEDRARPSTTSIDTADKLQAEVGSIPKPAGLLNKLRTDRTLLARFNKR